MLGFRIQVVLLPALPTQKEHHGLIIFREFAERPWIDTWQSLLLRFMRHLPLLPKDGLHLDNLQGLIADARGPVPSAMANLGMASLFFSSETPALDSHSFEALISWPRWPRPDNERGTTCMCPCRELPPWGTKRIEFIIPS